MITFDEAWLKQRADELKAAIFFLTRLRYGPAEPVGGAAIAQAAWAFPIAGIIVAAIGALVYWLAHRVGLPPLPCAALSVAATMLVTGALHEDGLADTVDGFGGGHSREQKLDIMRDSHTGAYGVCALVLAIILRVSALASLATPALVVPALFAAHGAARAVLPVFMLLVPPARSNGLSATAGQPPPESAGVAAVLGIVILGLCLGFVLGLAALVAVAVVAALLAWLSLTQIDGQTGDVLGAVEQVGEIVVLLVALA
jgi:adenosylcobinamide-GDP ribazoletransferase